jgi:hypothetical protein
MPLATRSTRSARHIEHLQYVAHDLTQRLFDFAVRHERDSTRFDFEPR